VGSWCDTPPEAVRWARWGSGEAGEGVHGFVDDWRLEALSRGSLGGVGEGRTWATEPDFSILGGMPEHVQRWQVYRARYLGDVMRETGLAVVPVLQWTGVDPIGWSCWGIRPESAVGVRAPGADSVERQRWAWGFVRALAVVRPSFVLVFGVASRVRGVLDAVGVPWRVVPLRRARGAA
jgi:hypothetical protein